MDNIITPEHKDYEATVYSAGFMISDFTERVEFFSNKLDGIDIKLGDGIVTDRVKHFLDRAEICDLTKVYGFPDFNKEAALLLMQSIEVPEEKVDRELAAVDFGKKYLANFDTKETKEFIVYHMGKHFKVSKTCCNDIIQIINSARKEKKTSVRYANPEPEEQPEQEIPEDVNSEILDSWEDYVLPKPSKGHYKISSEGIVRMESVYNKQEEDYVEKEFPVCRSPVVVCGVSTLEAGKDPLCKIRYTTTTSHEVKEAWVYQKDLLTKISLSKAFGQLGINCPDNGLLAETLEYVSLSMNQFGKNLKYEPSADQCGWNESRTRFVFGEKVYTDYGVEKAVPVGDCKFEPLRTRGDLKTWISLTDKLLYSDVCRFKFYDAMTAPINYLTGGEGHSIDHCKTTSVGKTLTDRICLSGYGNPGKGKGLLLTAESTYIGLMVDVKKYTDIMLVFDETSKAKPDFDRVIFAVANGVERSLGKKDGGNRGGRSFRSIAHMTGENSMADRLKRDGEMVRVITLTDPVDTLEYDEVERISKGIDENYGHVMDSYMRKVFEKKNDGSLEKLHKDCYDKLPEADSNVEGRSKNMFASILTAAHIVEEVFAEIGVRARDPVEIVTKYFTQCVKEKPIELEHIRALRVINDFIESNPKNFAICIGDNVMENEGSVRYGYIDDKHVDIINQQFNEILKKNDFGISKVKEDLEKIKVIAPRSSNGTTRVTRGSSKGISVIRIHREKMLEVLGLTDTSGVQEVPKSAEVLNVIKAVNLLTDTQGEAKLEIIKIIIPDMFAMESVLEGLAEENSIVKIRENVYKRAGIC